MQWRDIPDIENAVRQYKSPEAISHNALELNVKLMETIMTYSFLTRRDSGISRQDDLTSRPGSETGESQVCRVPHSQTQVARSRQHEQTYSIIIIVPKERWRKSRDWVIDDGSSHSPRNSQAKSRRYLLRMKAQRLGYAA